MFIKMKASYFLLPGHVSFECEMTFEIEQIIIQLIANPFICLFLTSNHLSKLLILYYDKISSREIFDITILLSILIQCKSLLSCS